MTHKRKQIRDAIVSILDTGTIVASGKVTSNRSLPYNDDNFPEIHVANVSEESERYQLKDNSLLRDAEVSIKAFATQSTDETLDDTLDSLAESIETAMKADDSLGGYAQDSFLSSTEFETSSEGSKPAGFVSLNYTVRYIQ